MSGPNWLNEAETNMEGPKLSDQKVEKEKTRLKPGPKKSLVSRSQVLLKMSEDKNKAVNNLVSLLNLSDVDLPRGRSEAVELAVELTTYLIKGGKPELESWVKTFVRENQGREDREAQDAQ